MKYKIINYNKWNFDGQGNNIMDFLSNIEKDLWIISLPYQDKRKDKGHAEIATYFALQLLKYGNGDRKIIIPSIILHDVGWSQMTETELKLFYEEKDDSFGTPIWKRYEPVLRLRHQEQGVKLAKKLLETINYNRQTSEISKIISKHDTGEGFNSEEEKIVKNADRLWRFTLPHIRVFKNQRKIHDICDVKERLIEYIFMDDFLYGGYAKVIAQLEMKNSLKYIAN